MKVKAVDVNALKSNWDELNAQMEVLRKEMQAKSRVYLEAVFNEFFTKHPIVEKVFWTQYTPYFNDGDECTFRVNDIYLHLDGEDEDEEDGEGTELYTQVDIDRYNEKVKNGEKVYNYQKENAESAVEFIAKYGDVTQLKEDFRELERVVSSIDTDYMEMMFGNHVKVIATPKGFEVDEYDHD